MADNDKKVKAVVSGKLTIEELIRSQLQGKSKALEQYDQILWKIRAGYLAVLYSLLTVLSGKDFNMQNVLGSVDKVEVLLYTAISFSLCALIMDLGFLFSKLRVVESRNELSDLAFELASPDGTGEKIPERLKTLLQLSGEKAVIPNFNMILNGIWPIILLYVTTPLALAIFLVYAG
jgi:hypothetical protein